MHSFEHRDSSMHCEEVPLDTLARQFGTPLYVYSHATLSRHYGVFDDAFSGVDHIICFSVKANPSLAVLDTLGSLGSGADVVSGGELYRATKAGIDAGRIVYSGVGKTTAEMMQALEAGILMFNIESFQELELLDRVAGEMGVRAPVSLRVNPDVDPKTHPYVATGLMTSKFGINLEYAASGYDRAARLENIDVIGVDCHIGSQLTDLSPFLDAFKMINGLINKLRKKGFNIRYLDLGGGLGITYEEEEPPSPAEYASAIKKVLKDEDLTIILEPGRNIAGNAGILLGRVLYTKETSRKNFVIVDAGMNDLIRPSLYDAYHALMPVTISNRPEKTVDVVGPICESGDFLARDRKMQELRTGDLIAVMSAGAYGFSMASTYNSRPLAAEVLVKGDQFYLIRERGTYDDLMRGERLPDTDTPG